MRAATSSSARGDPLPGYLVDRSPSASSISAGSNAASHLQEAVSSAPDPEEIAEDSSDRSRIGP